MKKTFVPYVGLLFLLIPFSVLAAFNLEARSDIERWSSGIGNQATGLWGGMAIGYSHNRYFASAGLSQSLDDYRVSGEPSVSMTRRDIDFSLGQQISPSFSLFAGYREFRIDYRNSKDTSRSFADNIKGLGGGIGFGKTLWPKASTFVSVSGSVVRSQLSYLSSEPVISGYGFSWGGELGIVYRFNRKIRGVASSKFQSMSIDYSGSIWNNNYTRAGFRLSYTF